MGDRARRPELWRFVYALGVPQVGTQTARDLAGHFGSLSRLAEADEAALQEVAGVGPTVAAAIVAFFRRADNRRIIDACLEPDPVARPAIEAVHDTLAALVGEPRLSGR